MEQAGEQSGSLMSGFDGVYAFFAQYWWVILIIIILVGGAALIIYLVYRAGLEQKRKDPNFLYYEQAVDACKLNGRADWVHKKRRWKMFFWGLLTAPLFALVYLVIFHGGSYIILTVWIVVGFLMWFPIAWFFYKDFSLRIVNADMHTRGFYRGHARRQDGFLYIAMKVGKRWLILDDILMLRFPENVLTMKTVEKTDKAGNKTKKLAWDKIDLQRYVIFNESGEYIFIPFTSIVKEGTYYYEPTMIQLKGNRIIDIRQKIAGSYHLMTQIQMAEQTYGHLGKVTNNAVDANVEVTARKKNPEKQRDVKGDGSNDE